MKKILFLALAIGMMSLSNAQVSKITTHPAGYQMTINAKELGMPLQYKGAIMQTRMLLSQYNLRDKDLAVEAMSRLDSLEKWIASLLPKIGGLHIDVIGQTHIGGPETDPAYQRDLLESQGTIKSILLTNQYDLIGEEGAPPVNVTKNMVTEGPGNALGVRNNKAGENNIVDNSFLYYGTFGQNRNAVHGLIMNNALKGMVMGYEDSTIYSLHLAVVNDPSFKPLNEVLTTLRSYIAFFTIAEQMLKTNARHGVIVIGCAHLTDFVWIARSTGVLMDFYATSPNVEFFKMISSRIPEGEE